MFGGRNPWLLLRGLVVDHELRAGLTEFVLLLKLGFLLQEINPLLQRLVLVLHPGVVPSEFIQLLRQLQVVLVDAFKVSLLLFQFTHLPFQAFDPLLFRLDHNSLLSHQLRLLLLLLKLLPPQITHLPRQLTNLLLLLTQSLLNFLHRAGLAAFVFFRREREDVEVVLGHLHHVLLGLLEFLLEQEA